jgi:hypothetical protein
VHPTFLTFVGSQLYGPRVSQPVKMQARRRATRRTAGFQPAKDAGETPAPRLRSAVASLQHRLAEMRGMRKFLLSSAANSSKGARRFAKVFPANLWARAAEGGMDGYASTEHPFRDARPDLARLT